jgi:ribosomal protein S18 acetylase RimI-like enzyme
MNQPNIKVVSNEDAAITVIKHVAEWMQAKGLPTDGWWDPSNMNATFLGKYAKPSEFYVATVDGQPAAAAIIQPEQTAQDWTAVDSDKAPKAMYIHWVAVERAFAGSGLPEALIDHAYRLAAEGECPVIRLDTNAEEPKLCQLYESLGFKRIATEQEGEHVTAFYEKAVKL